MTIKERERGEVLTYSNAGAAIAAGDVVPLSHCLGIALGSIAATTGTGSIAIRGVWLVPKVTGRAWISGEKLLWDVSAAKCDNSAATPAEGDMTGPCIAYGAAASGDATGLVVLTPGNVAIEPAPP